MIIITGKDKQMGVWQSGYAKYQLNDFSSPATVTWTSSGKSVTPDSRRVACAGAGHRFHQQQGQAPRSLQRLLPSAS